MGVQTRTDKRFRRLHVKPTRRRRSSTARRWLAGRLPFVLAAVVAFWLVPGLLMTAPFLRIDAISIQGNQRISNGEVLALVGELRGQNILKADLHVYRDRLATAGWVDTVALRRVLPSTVEIILEEREPSGLARFGRQLYVIDAVGTVIAPHGPGSADVDLPIVTGLSSSDAADDDGRLRLATQVLSALRIDPKLAAQVSEIDVRDPYDAVILLNDDPTLVRVGSERFAERVREYQELAPALRTHVPDIDYVDMRFEGRVVIGPGSGSVEPASLVASSHGSRSVSIQR